MILSNISICQKAVLSITQQALFKRQYSSYYRAIRKRLRISFCLLRINRSNIREIRIRKIRGAKIDVIVDDDGTTVKQYVIGFGTCTAVPSNAPCSESIHMALERWQHDRKNGEAGCSRVGAYT
jgi:hypothetical protein